MTRLKRVVRFYDKITEHGVTNGMRFSLFDQFFFVGDGESNLDDLLKRVDEAIVIDLVGDRIEIRFYFWGFSYQNTFNSSFRWASGRSKKPSKVSLILK
jgi:hypothetical protein